MKRKFTHAQNAVVEQYKGVKGELGSQIITPWYTAKCRFGLEPLNAVQNQEWGLAMPLHSTCHTLEPIPRLTNAYRLPAQVFNIGLLPCRSAHGDILRAEKKP